MPIPPAADLHPAGAADGLNLVGPDAGPPAAAPGEGAADAFSQQRRAVQQALQTEVQNLINQARGQMATNPAMAIQALRTQQEKVKQFPDLLPEVRDQMLSGLQAALKEGAKRLTEYEHNRQIRAEQIAAGKEQELIARDLDQHQQKIKQLMARFDSLMMEGRYHNEDRKAQDTIAEARKLAPE